MSFFRVPTLATSLVLCLIAATAMSAPPNLQTPSPVIYLADNLDEKDSLGFCIDTVGHGLSDRLHAHSCKPRGGDVQFLFDAENGRIAPATFANKCAALMAAPAAGVKLALLDCAEGPAQRFDYRADTGEFRPADGAGLCLAVGPDSRTAGPFMARDLVLADCADTEPARKKWVIKTAD